MRKYIVATVVASLPTDMAEELDAKWLADTTRKMLDDAGVEETAFLRASLRRCHTHDEAMAISRRGAP